MVIGIVWLSFVFFQGERVSGEFSLNPSDSAEMEMSFEGSDVGYYKIFMPDFSGIGVFVQILDQNYNVISDEIIETKMSVGYFDYENEGKYSLKISNASDDQIEIVVEFGETNSKQMVIPGVITLSGGLITTSVAFIKLRNYRIAQPDENIS